MILQPATKGKPNNSGQKRLIFSLPLALGHGHGRGHGHGQGHGHIDCSASQAKAGNRFGCFLSLDWLSLEFLNPPAQL